MDTLISSSSVSDVPTRRNLLDEFSPDCSSSNSGSQMEVFLRVRGLNNDELKKKNEKCVEITDKGNKIVVHLPKDSISFKNVQNGGNVLHEFTFSRIFGPEINQQNFYESTMHRVVQRFLWGDNCLVFAYGATNSGKTYTVQGLLSNPGLLPRSIDVIFNSIGNQLMTSISLKPNYFDNVVKLTQTAQKQEKALSDQLLNWGIDLDADTFCTTVDPSMISRVMNSISSDDSTVSARSCENFGSLKDASAQIEYRVKEEMRVSVGSNDVRFSVWVSFAEIYNEYVYDLLLPFTNQRLRRRTCLKLAEDQRGNVFIKGLRRVCVSNPTDAIKLLIIGQKNLRFAVTKLNQNSSRSHCIFTIETVCATNTENPKVVKISKLSFCDLAGSERYNKTKNTGDRLKEACSINTSLLVLGRCMSTLRTNQTLTRDSLKLIPFRESKLTRLFQNFFAKKGVVSMIVNISPDSMMCDESLHVLKFSALAEQVVIIPAEEKKLPSKASLMIAAMAQRGSVSWLSEANESDIGRDELYEYIDELTEKIKELEKENQSIEMRIRQEVTKAATASLVETEQYYSSQMRESREAAREYAEKQIELFIKQNTNKRRRTVDCDDSEDDDDQDKLEAELEDKNKMIKELNQVIDQLHIENQMLKDENNVLRKSNKRLSVSQANVRRQSTALKINAAVERKSSFTDFNKINEEELIAAEAKVTKLTQLLATAQADVYCKDEEIKRSNELVDVYEKNLANQADKKKRLTVDNEILKRELKVMQLRTVEEKENIQNNSSSPKSSKRAQLSRTTKTPNALLIGNLPAQKEIFYEENHSESETPSDKKRITSPITVKKLYSNAGKQLLLPPLDDSLPLDDTVPIGDDDTIPLDNSDDEMDIHSRVLERLKLK